jgi:hypothetical protein
VIWIAFAFAVSVWIAEGNSGRCICAADYAIDAAILILTTASALSIVLLLSSFL